MENIFLSDVKYHTKLNLFLYYRLERKAYTSLNGLIKRTKYTYPKIPPEDEKFIIRSPYSDVEIPEINLADFVWQNVEKWPENVSLVSFS